MSVPHILTVIGAGILLSAYTIPVHAASTSTSLSVVPAIIESIAKPGESLQTTVKLTNQTNVPLPIKGTVRDFIPTEDVSSESSSAYQASEWFHLEPKDFILQPREEKEITVSITAPRDAEPGGHYATVYFEPLIPKGAVSAGSTLSLARVGSLVFLIAPGDIQEKLEIRNISLPSYQSLGPAKIGIHIENTGNLHLVPTATVRVTNMFGKEVAQLKTNILTILPGTEREITAEWERRYLWGRFTFEGEILYGSEVAKIPIEKRAIWIVPWHLTILGLALLTTILYIVIVGHKRVKLAWRVLTGKIDAWEPKTATRITLESSIKETHNDTTHTIKKSKKSSKRRSRSRP